MTPRQLLTEALTGILPADVDVIPYSHNIDAPSASTVMVRFDRATPSPAAGGARLYQFTLIGIAAKTTAGPADDELDMLLEDVLAAIDGASTAGINWTEAVRGTYGEPEPTNPAFEVVCPITFAIESE